MLAAADQVAIDAVSARMMGFDPLSIRYLALAHERGLGVADPREIELVGDTEAARENWHFSVGDNFASRVGDVLLVRPAEGPAEALLPHAARVRLRRRVVLYPPTSSGTPVLGRRRVREFLRTSPWGALFARYLSDQAGGTIRRAAAGTRGGLGTADRAMRGR